jgi:hypothetical protein
VALILADRVQQTGTANTTVSFTLSGSVTGFQSFSVVGNGNTTYYSATDASGNWEVGIGTYATGGTLTRTTILSSSNSGSAVTFSGTVAVLLTYPSSKSVNLDASGNATALGTPTAFVGTNITGTASGLSIGGNAATATNVAYSGLTGTVPTWNQSTTGNAATITSQANSATITASTAATANQIVLRDGSGDDFRRYGFGNYFNSTDNSIGSGVTAIMSKQTDNYYRSATPAAVATFISGQSMNIAGNATTASSTPYPSFSSDSVNIGSIAGRIDTGFYENSAPTTAGGWPVTGSWYHLIACTHSNDANYYSMQFSASFFDNNNLYYRSTNGSGTTAWTAILTTSGTTFSGNLTMSGNITAYSDERLKTDWQPAKKTFVQELARVKSGTYTRTDTNEKQAGVSAQDIQKILPEVVFEDADKHLSLAYGNAAMVSCVEIAKVIEKMEAKIAELETQLRDK